ncbi:MAG: hypothetical protein F4X02_03740 [Chloroflexi bacterium]|nr:hypothetical protein [Chloroflexota bacterium]
MVEQVTRSLKLAGEWWVPDNYEGKKLGTLEWFPYKGCFLKLIDVSYEFEWGESPGLICGLNSDQDPVTLLGCRHAGRVGFKMTGNVSTESHWVQAHCALVGGLFESETEISITDLYVGYAGLDEYVIEDYAEYERVANEDGNYRIDSMTFNFTDYEAAKIGGTSLCLYVGWSRPGGLQLNHKLHFSFPADDHYRSIGKNLMLVHEIIPAFLSSIKGHRSFITALGTHVENARLEIYDGAHGSMTWNGEAEFRDRLVLGRRRSLDTWPAILPKWVDNYSAVSKLSKAYVKILSEEDDGFFNINNLVHVFFGIEAYCKEKCSRSRGRISLKEALTFTIARIRKYFEEVEDFVKEIDSLSVNTLSHARQVLVHANEGKPDYALVYHQLIFITRCVLLVEMEYPVANVKQDTQHWSSWHIPAERRKPEA